tara:strand:+ start:1882 stop:2457 length:576 start_codon:yes stop_codon:yes gene_type:complete
MAKAINKKDRIRIRKPKLQEKAIIMADNGICSLEADVGVMGIQLKFKGTAQITPELPEGWILQGNNNTIIIFTLQNNPIQNQTLFSYVGSMEIVGAIVSNDKGERLSERIKRNYANWGSQSFDFSVDTSSWEDYKDTKRVGKVKKTTYNLPDYDLPKVDKQIKKQQQRTERSQRTYSRTTSSSGSSGSGGY